MTLLGRHKKKTKRAEPFRATREKMFACAKCARCGVVFTPSVAYKGIAIACKRKNLNYKCAHYSCHLVDDHHVMEATTMIQKMAAISSLSSDQLTMQQVVL